MSAFSMARKPSQTDIERGNVYFIQKGKKYREFVDEKNRKVTRAFMISQIKFVFSFFLLG